MCFGIRLCKFPKLVEVGQVHFYMASCGVVYCLDGVVRSGR